MSGKKGTDSNFDKFRHLDIWICQSYVHILFSETHFSCENGLSQWCHNCIIITYYHASIDGTFDNFSVTQIVRMIYAKNCEKVSKFVKVTAKILPVLFSGHNVHVDCQCYWPQVASPLLTATGSDVAENVSLLLSIVSCSLKNSGWSSVVGEDTVSPWPPESKWSYKARIMCVRNNRLITVAITAAWRYGYLPTAPSCQPLGPAISDSWEWRLEEPSTMECHRHAVDSAVIWSAVQLVTAVTSSVKLTDAGLCRCHASPRNRVVNVGLWVCDV